MAINPDRLVKAKGNRNYHQGGMRYYSLILCLINFFSQKAVIMEGFVNKGGIKGQSHFADKPTLPDSVADMNQIVHQYVVTNE